MQEYCGAVEAAAAITVRKHTHRGVRSSPANSRRGSTCRRSMRLGGIGRSAAAARNGACTGTLFARHTRRWPVRGLGTPRETSSLGATAQPGAALTACRAWRRGPGSCSRQSSGRAWRAPEGDAARVSRACGGPAVGPRPHRLSSGRAARSATSSRQCLGSV